MKTKRGFTLLELLLVIAIIASLAGIILMALNPAQRLEEANETKYLANARDLKKAIEAYAIENGGILPTGFSSLGYGYYDICKEGESTDCINIDELIPEYLPSIPEDSNNSTAEITGFKVKYEPESKGIEVYTYEKYREWAEANGGTLTEGLVGYWKLDESSGNPIDSSGNDLTVTNTNSIYTAGQYGNSVTFDGGDKLTFGNIDYISTGELGNFTVTFWMFKTDSGVTQFIFGDEVGANKGVMFQLNSGQLCDFYPSSYRCTGFSPLLNTWYNIAMVQNGIDIRLYVNGQYYTTIGTYQHLETAGITYAGQWNGGSGRDYTGKVDELRIYNRALSETEVSALYEYGAPPIAQWKLDDNVSGDGQIIADSSGNGNNGTTNDGSNNTGMDCSVGGKYGRACNFDGVDDFVDMGNPASGILDFGTGGFSISSWIKAIGPQYDPIVTKGHGELGSGYALYFDSSNKIQFRLDGGSWMQSNSILNFNEWYHIEATYDGTQRKIYINGSEDKVINHSNVNSSSTRKFYLSGRDLGGGAPQAGQMFIGLIDDVKVYNYARTSQQVVMDMNYNI